MNLTSKKSLYSAIKYLVLALSIFIVHLLLNPNSELSVYWVLLSPVIFYYLFKRSKKVLIVLVLTSLAIFSYHDPVGILRIIILLGVFIILIFLLSLFKRLEEKKDIKGGIFKYLYNSILVILIAVFLWGLFKFASGIIWPLREKAKNEPLYNIFAFMIEKSPATGILILIVIITIIVVAREK